MPTFETFNLPDAGEGLTEADVVTWLVRIGDVVKVSTQTGEFQGRSAS